ncbi:hypothetical protein N9I02_02710 [Pontimonas sp.]|nr:hypothetical protein [Pontimonas sp.]MDA8887418.1 hypothetical protein [Pontimonas sp.]
MRVILTALMVLWLLVGCATPEEPEATAPSPRDTYLSFCPDVMHEISRYHEGFDRLIKSDDPADFNQVRSASLRMAGLAELASWRVGETVPLEGQWLHDLGVAAEAFYRLSTPESTAEEQVMAFDALFYGVIRAETFCAEAAI